jgi:uncharacterized protein
MNSSLAILIDLQKLDDTIRALESEIQSLPRKIGEIEGTLAVHIAQVEADKARVAENKKSRRKRENDITVYREKISKHKDQTLEVKTNEQYRALLHEIEFHEAAIRKIEDEILAEMIESDSLEQRLRQAEQSLAEERSRAAKEVAAATGRKQQDEQKLAAARLEREQARSQLPDGVYFSYERIFIARKGTAVAPVLDGACAACHVRLRPQAFNDVKTNLEILPCESCGCILYYVPPPPEPAAEPKPELNSELNPELNPELNR